MGPTSLRIENNQGIAEWCGEAFVNIRSTGRRRRFSPGGGKSMITKFDSLFAGHVDMDNVGYGGVPVNDRRFPSEHLVTAFDKAEAMAKLRDRLRCAHLWTGERTVQP